VSSKLLEDRQAEMDTAQQADWLPLEVQLEQPYVALQDAARLAANSRAQLRSLRSTNSLKSSICHTKKPDERTLPSSRKSNKRYNSGNHQGVRST
jgi:hypothetical protein